ncbi:uncharacterized protein [Oryza sativa Japonica Group]|uniref:MCM N-terminal domain-containing protein n=1 Tax=Oryza sativa subsp. japonica TaxID=39947 RepID=Q650V0_ORYSJ|nr:uncharacterized protein LOC107276297 isoform X1 [Oryza sativa Japonica Group]BAD46245.1 hypothetical protein [Oryza sativa Japonica Group]BAD46667.1 hypothetical protein [Oryza sativa Japonica Group]
MAAAGTSVARIAAAATTRVSEVEPPPATPSRASTPVPSPVPSPSSTFPDFAEEYIRHSFLVRLTQSSDARVAERFMQFLVNYTAPGDQLPFYPTEARALLQRKNSDCHELLVHFDHLREMDKILAFHMCNNQNRLAPILSCVASQFLLNISLQDDVSEETREEKVIKHKPTIESKVILRFIGMPNYRITTLKEFLVKNQDALVEKVRLFSKDNVLVPAKLGSSLFQCCILHLIANHKMGVSWNGEFELTDWEISDDMVSLKKVHHGPLPDDSKVADLEKLVDLLAPFFLKKGSPLFFKQLKDDVTLTSRTLVSASDWEWFWDYLGSHVFYMPPVARLHLIKDLFVAIKTFKLTWVKPFSTVLLDFTEFGDWTIGPMSKTDGQESIYYKVFWHKVKPEDIDPKNPKYWPNYGDLLSFIRNLIEHLDEHKHEENITDIVDAELFASNSYQDFLPQFLQRVSSACLMQGKFKSSWDAFKGSGRCDISGNVNLAA